MTEPAKKVHKIKRSDLAELRAMAGELSGALVGRALMAARAGTTFNGDRDLYETCGYPRDIRPEDYMAEYLRGGIAGRLGDAYPDATWREAPTINAQEEDGGAFADAIWELDERVKLWSKLARVDRLSQLGHYGVLILGLNGGEQMWSAARRSDYRLIYLKPHGEMTAPVSKWENDPASPRFGRPEVYNVTVGSSRSGVGIGGVSQNMRVHWSRAIHIAEKPLDDDSIGLPRLERVWNRLLDVDKLLGGSAEVWWQNAAGLWALKADPELEWDPEDKEELEGQITEMQHRLRRWLRLRGVEPENIAAETDDPSGAIDKQLDIIAGATGIPKRILLGSEAGELASSQDENNWSGRVAERREQHATPNMVRPTIDRLIALGCLPAPKGGRYEVVWPAADSLGEQARSTIGQAKAAALQSYMNTPGAELIVPPMEFRTEILGLPAEPETGEILGQPEEPPLEETGEAAEQFAELAANRTRRAPAVTITGPMMENFSTESVQRLVETINKHIEGAQTALIDNARPRTLYISRKVLNWQEIAKWAKSQGFDTTLGDKMHVTIAFSRQPIDWMKVGESWSGGGDEWAKGTLTIRAGGPRVVEKLGPKNAIVLMFASSELCWRHRDICNAGASWDYPEYQPHITISYSHEGVDLEQVQPYRGIIELGPEEFEEFEEVDEEWGDRAAAEEQ